MKNRGIFFNKKLHRIRGLKGMCQEKMKRIRVYDSSSFYSDTFPLILVFYAAFYWMFSSNRRWIVTDTIDRYYQSCWLPIASIYRLKIFNFLPIVSIFGSKKKMFFFIDKIKPTAKIFFFLKIIDLIDVFLQLIDYRHRSNQCFFHHRCPSMYIYINTLGWAKRWGDTLENAKRILYSL